MNAFSEGRRVASHDMGSILIVLPLELVCARLMTIISTKYQTLRGASIQSDAVAMVQRVHLVQSS